MFDTIKVEYNDATEYNTFDSIRLFVVNKLNPGWKQAAIAGGAMSSVNPAGENIVVFTEEFFNYVGNKSAEAIVWHEVGHFELGHRSESAKGATINGVKYLFSDEVAADNFAAKYVGKKAIREAVMKCSRFFGKNLCGIEAVGVAIFLMMFPKRMFKLFF